jgi:hypothetical protein
MTSSIFILSDKWLTSSKNGKWTIYRSNQSIINDIIIEQFKFLKWNLKARLLQKNKKSSSLTKANGQQRPIEINDVSPKSLYVAQYLHARCE